MMGAGRRVIHSARTGGGTTHAERDEWAVGPPFALEDLEVSGASGGSGGARR
jgi:hypothetical protein